ncbi:MAG TPA: hypothetical protein VJ508_02155 [Saprospiraceae bacterium]|nr:hypothetical protein [Saprospiraceae bacterium]
MAIGGLCLLTGCITRDSGCLDPEAASFDITADKACDGCCTYPTISLALTQKWHGQNFSTDSTYYDSHQLPFQIHDIQFFLSSWSWHDLEQVWSTVDSTTVACGSDSLTYTKDIALVDPQHFSFTLGTVRKAVQMDSLHLYLGLTEDFSCLDPASSTTPSFLTSGSTLWNPTTNMLNSVRLVINRNPQDSLLDTLWIQETLPVTTPYAYDFIRGKNTTLRLTLDYGVWFQSADVMDSATFVQSLRDHWRESIFKTE